MSIELEDVESVAGSSVESPADIESGETAYRGEQDINYDDTDNQESQSPEKVVEAPVVDEKYASLVKEVESLKRQLTSSQPQQTQQLQQAQVPFKNQLKDALYNKQREYAALEGNYDTTPDQKAKVYNDIISLQKAIDYEVEKENTVRARTDSDSYTINSVMSRLSEAIPGYGETKALELQEHAVKNMGFTPEVAAVFGHPLAYKYGFMAMGYTPQQADYLAQQSVLQITKFVDSHKGKLGNKDIRSKEVKTPPKVERVGNIAQNKGIDKDNLESLKEKFLQSKDSDDLHNYMVARANANLKKRRQ